MKFIKSRTFLIVLFLTIALIIVLAYVYMRMQNNNSRDNNRDMKKQLDTNSKYTQIYTKFFNFEESTDPNTSTAIARSGHNSIRLMPGNEYCPGLDIKFSDIQNEITPIEITASAYVYSESDLKGNPVTMIFQVTDHDKKIDYIGLNSEEIGATRKGWNEIYNRQTITNITSLNNVISVYVFYRGTQKVYVDDLLITIFKVTKN
jgi:hypothetical protein